MATILHSSQLQYYREGVLAVLRPLAFETQGLWPGRLDIEQIRRALMATPALRLALYGGRTTGVGNDQLNLGLSCVAFVICRLGVALRDDEALQLVEQVAERVQGEQFGVAGALPAQVSGVQNLWTGSGRGKLQGTALTLWGVSWEATLRLGHDFWQRNGRLVRLSAREMATQREVVVVEASTEEEG